MASIPSTIVVFSEDKVNFPLKWALVVMKQLFQYGVTKISIKDEKIFIELTYTPNAQKLKNKFGTLPVRYMRMKVENPQEFKIL
ncbi:hypothetical protein NQ315_012494 [Exocentrus adspersus]|uniref:LAGLIDADG homing endonuclease n=1 Tax=Exocentrus adspersus TaxID=1586481 RepID=A0AAV8V9E6_9CUCU|nr:hypothetical protein NQ315_012494 [Exocentrus adspersus]